MSTDNLQLSEEEYNSADDQDFDPNSVQALGDDLTSSDSECDEASGKPQRKSAKKRKRTVSFDEGGEGGLIKTRSQRAVEAREKLGGVAEGEVTTDVDKLWAHMSAAPVRKSAPQNTQITKDKPTQTSGIKDDGLNGRLVKEVPGEETISETGEKMVKIKSTYEFAGQTITEEKLVPASSMTARAHLSSSASDPQTSLDQNAPKRRAPPKKRASAFDSAAASRAKPIAPTKLNTLEKSRLDWAGFVDKEGIGDDLQKFNKGDKGYLDRQAFLGRVDENRDKQWRQAKGV
ncbi:bucentaur or craniofacial development-domain-containing protein [Geopyxis carbonaria]|nr:bucentaur or craniofacial development-domain-containing protein [Geopyxis carbonaria]